MAQTALLTADDLFSMGGEERYELVNGALVPMSPPPGFRHGKVIMNLAFPVTAFVREHGLGWTTGAETGFRLRRDPDTVRGPDFAFVARGRVTPDMDQSRYLDLPPDLVAEVVSPSDSAVVNTKVLEYLDAGVRLVWVLYPDSQTIGVRRVDGSGQTLRAGDMLSGEDVLSGFSCSIADLFADPELPAPGRPVA